MTRPIILSIENSSAEFWAMAPKAHYKCFNRRNLCTRNLVEAAHEFVWSVASETTVVVMGDLLRLAINKSLSRQIKKVLIHPQYIDRVTWRIIPAERVSRMYEDESVRTLVGTLLEDLNDERNYR